MGFFVACRGLRGLVAVDHGRFGMESYFGPFAGFGDEGRSGPEPYLVERLLATVYRRCKVPWYLDRRDLIAWAVDRAAAAGRRMCLVLGPGDCVYVEPDGSSAEHPIAPSGGFVFRD
jgi:hypothetical protein